MKEIDNEVKGVGKIEFFRFLYKVNVGYLHEFHIIECIINIWMYLTLVEFKDWSLWNTQFFKEEGLKWRGLTLKPTYTRGSDFEFI